MADSRIYALWTRLLKSNPRISAGIRDALAESDLTQEERELIEKQWLDSRVSAGKFKKSVYGQDVDTVGEAAEREHQRSLQAQQDTTRAYSKDVEGSYQQAKENAHQGGFFEQEDPRDDFINRARSAAMAAFEQDRRDELDGLSNKYNIPRNLVKSDTINVLDTPVSVANAVGQDVGEIFGDVQNAHSTAASGVFGKDSALAKGLDNTSRIASAVNVDISDLVTQSPFITKNIKRIHEAGDKVKDLAQVNGFLDGLHNVHSSWLRGLVHEFADVLNEWYHDPRTLCCFIKNIAAMSGAFEGRMLEMQKKYFAGQESEGLSDTRAFFDRLIAILKIIKQFLQQHVPFNVMLGIDLGLGMSKAMFAAVVAFLMILQQSLEDTIYHQLLSIVERNINEEWRQCFPFERLLKIIADFLTGPDGLFKYIEQYVDSFLASFSTGVNYGFNLKNKQLMVDLTAIDKLISMLESIRDALLNLELCIEADFRETDELHDDANKSEKRVGFGNRNYSDLINKARGSGKDGTEDNVLGTLSSVVFPTDNEVKSLIMNRLGETEAFADQVIATANKTSDISGRATGSTDSSFAGQIEKAIGDCSRTLDNDKIQDLANLMADWELGI